MILIHSHWMTIAVLAVVISLFDNLRERRSGNARFTILVACRVEIAALPCRLLDIQRFENNSQIHYFSTKLG